MAGQSVCAQPYVGKVLANDDYTAGADVDCLPEAGLYFPCAMFGISEAQKFLMAGLTSLLLAVVAATKCKGDNRE